MYLIKALTIIGHTEIIELDGSIECGNTVNNAIEKLERCRGEEVVHYVVLKAVVVEEQGDPSRVVPDSVRRQYQQPVDRLGGQLH